MLRQRGEWPTDVIARRFGLKQVRLNRVGERTYFFGSTPAFLDAREAFEAAGVAFREAPVSRAICVRESDAEACDVQDCG